MRYPIDLNLSEKLKDKEYRHNFFRVITQDEIAESIRELRLTRGLRQSDLAERCSMKQSAISRIEQSSYSRWSFNTLWRLADALDARIRLVIEPMENVIKQYELMERGAGQRSDLTELLSEMQNNFRLGKPEERRESISDLLATESKRKLENLISPKEEDESVLALNLSTKEPQKREPNEVLKGQLA